MEFRGPGFNRSIARAVASARPGARLVFCECRRYWLVVERAPDTDTTWWSGVHRHGWRILLHWCGRGGAYSNRGEGRGTFLPLDTRLLDVLRTGDPARRSESHAAEVGRLEAEGDRLKRLADERAKDDVRRRIVAARAIPEYSIPGLSPALANPRRIAEERMRARAGV